MAVTIDLKTEAQAGIAIGIADGNMTVQDIKDAAKAVWSATDGSTTRFLWDLSSAHFVLEVSEVRELAEFVKGFMHGSMVRSAFVASGDLEFGIARMFERFREADGWRVSVFRDRASAIDWLLGKTD